MCVRAGKCAECEETSPRGSGGGSAARADPGCAAVLWKGNLAEEQLCRVPRRGQTQGYLKTTSMAMAWGHSVARVGAVVAGQQSGSSDEPGRDLDKRLH